MIVLEWLKALLYGIVEGITEWLPISSTGHLILVEEWLPFRFAGMDAAFHAEFWEMFEVVIQLGAILAVVVLFFRRGIMGDKELPDVMRNLGKKISQKKLKAKEGAVDENGTEA